MFLKLNKNKMSDLTLRSAFRRGFTLIELMIVIVILGVLMGTILPRLTGAQSRARDTGRIADLNTIAQALETYYDDNGQYPGENGTEYCLNTGEDKISPSLSGYLKAQKVPTPPQSGQKTLSCTGGYVYAPITSKGIDNNGFLLLTDVETYQLANFDAQDFDVQKSVDDLNKAMKKGTDLASVDDQDENRTVYLLIGT